MRQAITLQRVGSGSSTIVYDITTPIKTQLANAKALALSYNSGSGASIYISVWENVVTHTYVVNPAVTNIIITRSR